MKYESPRHPEQPIAKDIIKNTLPLVHDLGKEVQNPDEEDPSAYYEYVTDVKTLPKDVRQHIGSLDLNFKPQVLYLGGTDTKACIGLSELKEDGLFAYYDFSQGKDVIIATKDERNESTQITGHIDTGEQAIIQNILTAMRES